MFHCKYCPWVLCLTLLFVQYGYFAVLRTPADHQSDRLNHLPDNMYVLENTVAWFNWTHTLGGPTKIVWDYRKDKDSNNEVILILANTELEIPVTAFKKRIEYFNFSGSATMFLKNVTTNDSGTYQVKISQSHATSSTGRESVRMSVVRASDVEISVSIDNVRFDLSVANNGSNISLPGSRVMSSEQPDITIEISDFVPTPLSIIHNLNTREDSPPTTNKQVGICEKKRKCTFPWFNEITIRIIFDIQNLDPIIIQKHIKVASWWAQFPGDLHVLAGTSARFTWTHTIQGSVSITWRHENMTHENSSTSKPIMNYERHQLQFPSHDQLYHRLSYENFLGSAIMELRNVQKYDIGAYDVNVLDIGSVDRFNISSYAYLFVYNESELEFSMRINEELFDFSVQDNGTDILFDGSQFVNNSGFTIIVKIEESAPRASVIEIHDSKKIRQCPNERICESEHDWDKGCMYSQTEVITKIAFGIQHLKNITVTIRFDIPIEQKDDSCGDCTICWSLHTITVITLTVAIVQCAIIIHTRRDAREENEINQTEEKAHNALGCNEENERNEMNETTNSALECEDVSESEETEETATMAPQREDENERNERNETTNNAPECEDENERNERNETTNNAPECEDENERNERNETTNNAPECEDENERNERNETTNNAPECTDENERGETEGTATIAPQCEDGNERNDRKEEATIAPHCKDENERNETKEKSNNVPKFKDENEPNEEDEEATITVRNNVGDETICIANIAVHFTKVNNIHISHTQRDDNKNGMSLQEENVDVTQTNIQHDLTEREGFEITEESFRQLSTNSEESYHTATDSEAAELLKEQESVNDDFEDIQTEDDGSAKPLLKKQP